MRLLLITNLYPPQELGGYGRCMADFCWGLKQRGHQLQVICNDASYLGRASTTGPSGEPVARELLLKGDFSDGVHLMQNASEQNAVDIHNQAVIQRWLGKDRWDGILLGNIDLLGVGLLHWLLDRTLPVLHHVGFVQSPYAVEQQPNIENYQLLAASHAVKTRLIKEGIRATNATIVYPGARTDLFGPEAIHRAPPNPPCRIKGKPLHLCFAGLLMESKAPHTLLEAIAQLHQQGYPIRASLAGAPFQKSYVKAMKSFCVDNKINNLITFYKQLTRDQLARFFLLHHAAVFPSMHPEAFGIVAVEAMASGLVLLSSGVGGASEVFEDNKSGLQFEAGNAHSLTTQIKRLFDDPGLLNALQKKGLIRAREQFDVQLSAQQIEEILLRKNHTDYPSCIQQF
ncbi:glycosyltransferase family 4 protein [Synechococcus sp. MU1642]|uniref:glycosyltransferase family 4 protein n=1 Tax=Synechococcus sp. MU1642 TaxID=2508348 RepID=UPI001CF8AE24|nr:glycosyltransferase family 4 protein [Synechococcus sp. MU1642]MCB4406932.1 glycosyltransferase family 4 protein [Synechococcus sp. MU1642]